jgi:hypothetical protein
MNEVKNAAFKELFGRAPTEEEAASISKDVDSKDKFRNKLITIKDSRDIWKTFVDLFKEAGASEPEIADQALHMIADLMIPDLTMDRETGLRAISAMGKHLAELFVEGRDTMAGKNSPPDVIHLGFKEDEKINAPFTVTKQ